MNTLFSNEKFVYNGFQLRPRFIYEKWGIFGDAVVAWVGGCDIPAEHMVDWEDRRANETITGSEMLHFIVEVFKTDALLAVALQRILVNIATDELRRVCSDHLFLREGDDIYGREKRKLSISVATVSASSLLIHLGINVTNKGTPVPTLALADFSIDPSNFAEVILLSFRREFLSMYSALYKVRSI